MVHRAICLLICFQDHKFFFEHDDDDHLLYWNMLITLPEIFINVDIFCHACMHGENLISAQ